MNNSNQGRLYGLGVNSKIAAKIVDLFKKGQTLDFNALDEYKIFCIHEKRNISLKELSIRVVDECFDQLGIENK